MNVGAKPKIVLLGIISRMPVGGLVWQTLQYMVGLERLGYELYYVEQHGSTPRMFIQTKDDDGWAKAAAYIAELMRRFDFGERWAYHVLHDGRCYGMSRARVNALLSQAALVVNLHGSTKPLPEHSATGRLLFLETDPVDVQIGMQEDSKKMRAFLEPHAAFFTWGENYGHADCRVPAVAGFDFKPTRPAVVSDFWAANGDGAGHRLTTVGNWRQPCRLFNHAGEVYHWSKHYEFMKFLDLPRLTGQAFELALSSYEEEDRRLLEDHGWRVRDALPFSADLDAYRRYIKRSRGEFTVAKDQNVRLRSGWFSERSATYLAAGRPVVTQETGFSNHLPTGAGLFGFLNIEEAAGAVEAVNADYERHARAALNIARECFDYRVVLPPMLAAMGL
ncbi:MAG TPA: hypothetical protein VKA60_17380 [Blastocatellia bacterium]|nr:hypothetical protein [Blastocatellia bacterium]